jgi:hypothetical protein
MLTLGSVESMILISSEFTLWISGLSSGSCLQHSIQINYKIRSYSNIKKNQ